MFLFYDGYSASLPIFLKDMLVTLYTLQVSFCISKFERFRLKKLEVSEFADGVGDGSVEDLS